MKKSQITGIFFVILALVIVIGAAWLMIGLLTEPQTPTGAVVKDTGVTSAGTGTIPSEIRMVAIPGEEQNDQLLYMQPLVNYISREIGIPVKLTVATDYTATIEALRYKHAEIAWLGPFAYVLATQVTDVEPFVGGVKKGGELTYRSIIFTRMDSGIDRLEDIKGKTFAFNDPGSTSGYLVPMYAFKKKGIDPERDFKTVSFAGSHAASQLAVYNGKADAGASNLPTYEKMVKNGQIDPSIQIIIWKSSPIPASPIVARSDLDAELINKIQKAFLDADEKMGIVKGVGNKEFEGFEAVKDSDYNVLRNIAKELGLDLSKVD